LRSLTYHHHQSFHILSQITDTLFVAFAAVFFVTRNIIFPFYIIRNTVLGLGSYVPDIRATKVCIGFMCVLACLHYFWFSLIVKMAVRMSKEGAATKDERSDDESYLEQSIVRARSSYKEE